MIQIKSKLVAHHAEIISVKCCVPHVRNDSELTFTAEIWHAYCMLDDA